MHPDFTDLLAVFADEGVEYLVIGGYAVSHHTRPRFTKDIDLWVRDTPQNLERVARALERFGAPEQVIAGIEGGSAEDIVWFGIPPTRVDILRRIDGVEFEPAYSRRIEARWDDVPVSIIARDDLIASKRAAGRDQDLRDVRALERVK
jgi:predicted nucleotidyltransferase